jgi:hypothetical protein
MIAGHHDYGTRVLAYIDEQYEPLDPNYRP